QTGRIPNLLQRPGAARASRRADWRLPDRRRGALCVGAGAQPDHPDPPLSPLVSEADGLRRADAARPGLCGALPAIARHPRNARRSSSGRPGFVSPARFAEPIHMRVLVLVDHAVGISGPHRNVVGTLNALSAREDVDLRVLTGKIGASEPYAARCEIR